MEYDIQTIRLFCELSPLATAVYQVIDDGSIKTLAYSDALPDLVGVAPEEYPQRCSGDLISLVVPQDREYVREAIAVALDESRDVDCSYRSIFEDGEYHWMNVRGRYIGEYEGYPIFLAEFLDTTRETRMHSNLLDLTSNGIYICDEKTRELLYVNQMALDFWGRNGDPSGRPCFQFFRGRDTVCPWCVCNDEMPHSVQIESIDDPDHEGYLKISCSRLQWYGRPAYCISFEDVTGERRAQEELRNIIERIPAAVIVYREKDGRSDIIHLNGAVEEIAGLSKDTIIEQGNDRGIKEHVHPQDVQAIEGGLARLFSDDHEAEFVYRDRPAPDKPYRWLHYRGRSYPQFDGTQLAYSVLTDITESMETKKISDNIVDIIAHLPVTSMLLEYLPGARVRPVSFSDEFCAMLGITQQEAWSLYGKNALEAVYPDDREALINFAVEHIHAHDTGFQSLTHRFLRPDGEIVWVISNFSFFNTDGKDYGYMVYTDISDVKAEESEFIRRYLEEQSYLDSVADSYIAAMRVNVTCNRVETISGTSPAVTMDGKPLVYDDMVREHILPGLPYESDRAQFDQVLSRKALLDAYAKGARSAEIEYRYLPNPNADQVWVRVSATLMRDPEGDDVFSFVIVQSIDDEKTDQQIFERMMGSDECDFIAIIDVKKPAITFRRVTDGAPAYPGGSALDYEMTTQHHIEAHVPADEYDDIVSAISLETIIEQLAKESTYSCTFTFVNDDASSRRKLLRYSYLDPLKSKILVIQTDITEAYLKEQEYTKRLEKALQDAKEANAAKSDFLSRMSHDIRTPMNGIIGMTHIALEQENPPKTEDCLAKIDTSSHFLLGLVNDILDLSKVESGKLELHLEPYTNQEFFDYIDAIIRPLYEEKNITFIADGELVDTVAPLMDRLRVNQMFFNLLSNAIKFTPEGGTVRCHVVEHLLDNGKLAMKALISDTGIGMSEEFQQHLFEPFSQELSRETVKGQGSGLGLAIVKRIIDLIGGDISVKSVKGKGTTFTILQDYDCVPIASIRKQEEREKIDDTGALKGRHVLLCEDHPLNQEIAIHILEKAGMVVTVAEDGQRGLDAFAASPVGYYDAVLMDIRMPVMDGYETTRAIRSLGRDDALRVPIIAMTADAYADDVRKCHEAGMDAHIAKPIDRALLMETLERYLG